MDRCVLCFAVATLAAVAGCVDPKGDYDAFGDRLVQDKGTSSSSSSTGAGGGSCTLPMNGEADGDYYMLLSAITLPTKPVAFKANLKATPASGGGLDVAFKAQALLASDRRTPVGNTLAASSATVAKDGTFTINYATIVVDPAADSVVANQEIDADTAVLIGSFCDPTFVCGSVTGNVTKPIPTSLDGSTFTLQPIVGSTFPAHDYYDCAMDEAAPLQ